MRHHQRPINMDGKRKTPEQDREDARACNGYKRLGEAGCASTIESRKLRTLSHEALLQSRLKFEPRISRV